MLLKSNLPALVFPKFNSKELFWPHDIINDSVLLLPQEPLAVASGGMLIFKVLFESASFKSNCAATDIKMQFLVLLGKFTVQLATTGSTGGVGVVGGFTVVLVVVVFGDGVGWVVVVDLGVVVVLVEGVTVVVDAVDVVGLEVEVG